MRDLLLARRVLSLNHATKILRRFKQKKHASAGYFFELEDLGFYAYSTKFYEYFGDELNVPTFWSRVMYGEYGPLTNLYVLKVFRTVP